MKITLRRANALQAAINETLKSTDLNLSVELNEFQNAEDTLSAATQKLVEDDNRRKALLETLYTIRDIVGQANARAGIDGKLTQLAFLSKRIEQLSEINDAKVATDLVVLKGKIEHVKQLAAGERMYRDTVSTGVLTQQLIDSYKKEVQQLKKTKQKISDEILSLNIVTEIDLDATSIEVLNKENLL